MISNAWPPAQLSYISLAPDLDIITQTIPINTGWLPTSTLGSAISAIVTARNALTNTTIPALLVPSITTNGCNTLTDAITSAPKAHIMLVELRESISTLLLAILSIQGLALSVILAANSVPIIITNAINVRKITIWLTTRRPARALLLASNAPMHQ